MKHVVKNQTPKSTAWLSKHGPKKIFDVVLLMLLKRLLGIKKEIS